MIRAPLSKKKMGWLEGREKDLAEHKFIGLFKRGSITDPFALSLLNLCRISFLSETTVTNHFGIRRDKLREWLRWSPSESFRSSHLRCTFTSLPHLRSQSYIRTSSMDESSITTFLRFRRTRRKNFVSRRQLLSSFAYRNTHELNMEQRIGIALCVFTSYMIEMR